MTTVRKTKAGVSGKLARSRLVQIFVVENRQTQVVATEPTGLDRLRFELTYKKDSWIDEGWSRGQLHTVTAPHIITTRPKPGDRILLVLDGEIVEEGKMDNNGLQDYFRVDKRSVTIERTIEDSRGFEFEVCVKSVLGRQVLLGEDGAESAFGQNLLGKIEHDLASGGYRETIAYPCNCEIERKM